MLTESFLAATLTPEKPSQNTTLGIHIHELQPLKSLRFTFKKSSSSTNCVAVNRTHIFAAQAEKAVVHVYNRERLNQEAIVPFPERIHAVALAGEKDGAGILALGTEGGRIILWELGTGRQVTTPQHHLQPINCLAVDLRSNFLLSGSSDSSIHVWSLPNLLSFSAASSSDHGQEIPYSPLRSLSAHRSPVTALVPGHSSSGNIAVSTSRDGTCIVWDPVNGVALHTYLLANDPLCLVLDPADRALYIGHEDGSIQHVDFFKQAHLTNPLYDPALRDHPSQPLEKDRWSSALGGDASAIIALEINYDGTLLISGHRNGKIHTWDIASGRLLKQVADLVAPVSNLIMLPPVGFSHAARPSVMLHSVIKPRYESFVGGASQREAAIVPLKYTFTAQFSSSLSISSSNEISSFDDALTHPSFPTSMLEKAVAELGPGNDPFGNADSAAFEELHKKTSALSSKLEVALTQQRNAEKAAEERDQADWERRQDEEIKATKKKRRRLLRIEAEEVMRKKEMGEPVDHIDGALAVEEEGLSSSTDEE